MFGFILSFILGLATVYANSQSVKATNKQNKDLQEDAQQHADAAAERANEMSIEQWNRENQYNTPANQMQRLADAGVNPALAYSNGVSNTAATSPDTFLPQTVNPAEMLPWQMDSSLSNIAAQAELTRAQADSARADADLKRSQLPLNDQKLSNMKQEVEESVARVNDLNAAADLKVEQAKTERERQKAIRDERKSLRNNFILSKRKIDAEIDKMASEMKLNSAQVDKIKAETDHVRRLLFELRETWLDRQKILKDDVTRSNIGVKEDAAEMLEIIAQLRQYGIDYDFNTGKFDVDFESSQYLYANTNDVIVWSRAILSTLGSVFGANVSLGSLITRKPK